MVRPICVRDDIRARVEQGVLSGFRPAHRHLLAFGTFASAYLARIVGVALFGHFGDRLGCKSMLLVSLLLMGCATFCI
ncbi:hypothetical protein QHI69_20210 [Burkholderia gladioli pv. gladioli]|uniref:hypothetical protein n=1 Tax=Burkholderia gladioli TaxID=28095 RepID=UPI000A9055D8|nr:hypothetical protein [Burkholderia gladioli]MDJ1164207.1 hypothetical protein [Burkholderia gladioli pv. gladioli]QPQ84164.1 hypothetical protein I6H08_03530 [Burkholderia gladioli]